MTLGPSRSSILFCRSSNRVTTGTALTAASTKGGNLGRARGRQPQATSAGPHVTSGLINFGLSLRRCPLTLRSTQVWKEGRQLFLLVTHVPGGCFHHSPK